MAVKHFLINTAINHLSKEKIAELEQGRIKASETAWNSREQLAKDAIKQECNLKHTFGRILCQVDLELKNYHVFESGLKIRRERQFNEFNRRITQPVNAIVISGDNIPKGSEILIGHNSLHDSNKIFSYETQSPHIQYFSIPEYECFAWRDTDNELKPMPNYEFALRVFRPYKGTITAITPATLTDILYITTGKLKGKIIHTLKASDYQIVFQNQQGVEDNIIRIRHSEDSEFDREEVMAISNELTEQLNNGELWVGLDAGTSKTLKEYYGSC